jgi:hypothetical protein
MKLFPRILKFTYYFMIVSAFCANMIVVSHTTALSVLGAGLALRGPDGAMMTATDGLFEERRAVFTIFGVGLACTVGSVVVCVWILLIWESALICMILALMTCRIIWINYQRVQKRFAYDENETVDFRDIMEGPAAIQAVPWRSAPKKAASLPLEVEEDFHSHDRFDLEFQQSNMRLLNTNEIVKRRGRNSPPAPSPEHYIQTI